MNRYYIIMILVAFQGIAQAQTLKGTASHIYDGDTFRLNQSDGSFMRIRLANIDAPEIQQSYGLQARYFLNKLIDRKTVEVHITATDRYGRKIALLYLDGREVNQLLVANGLAWNYHRYSTDTTLVSVESEARTNKIGLWREDNPMPPWQFRQGAFDKK